MSNSNPTATAFRASVALVLEETKNVNELRRLAHTKQFQFAIDVCLVAHGVRTGYLVDAIYPPNPTETFPALLMALRSKSTVFGEVVFWHHTPTTQTFLVHVPLLQQKIAALLRGARECIFIKLDKCPSASRDPPHALREALHDMGSAMAEYHDTLVLSLSELYTEEVLIPLAAVVIDYPVAYFPAFPAQRSFLEGEALGIYTVSLKWTTNSDSTVGLGEQHVLLKFSCPHLLANDDTELSPSAVIEKLHVKFAAILERIGASILITHRTETPERVAL